MWSDEQIFKERQLNNGPILKPLWLFQSVEQPSFETRDQDPFPHWGQPIFSNHTSHHTARYNKNPTELNILIYIFFLLSSWVASRLSY